MEKEHAELDHDQLRKQPSKASWLKELQASPEHIGHMLMTAETKPDDTVKRLSGKRVETLNRAQLLELSEKIIIDGSSLRQIYETHLIGERGLRRLTAEYIQGGDLKQALREEIIERERDFERDPAMRDMMPDLPAASNSTQASQSAQSTLEELLDKVGITSGNPSEETAFFKARARYEARELHQHKQQRRLIDISLSAVILILLIMVIILLMKRG